MSLSVAYKRLAGPATVVGLEGTSQLWFGPAAGVVGHARERIRAGVFPALLMLGTMAIFWPSEGAAQGSAALQPGPDLVQRALAAELKAAQDTGHPMRYKLRKSTPRLTSTKEIIETRDGNVAILLAVNDGPVSDTDREKDNARLDGLLADPARQQHRRQNEQTDKGRALKVLRALPKAFIYQYAGPVSVGGVAAEKFTLRHNPKFDPPDLETQVLTGLAGEIWIDAAHERVLRLEAHLQQDVDFGWGILARLNKGGWLIIDQADVGGGQWRIVKFQMVMNGRVFIKTRSFDTVEEETGFAPVRVGMTYPQAIQMLRSGDASNGGQGR